MAAQIDSSKPLHVRLVHLANGDTLEDKNVFIASGFLIVEADREDVAPTWYNLNEVTALQEVTIEGQRNRPQECFIRFI